MSEVKTSESCPFSIFETLSVVMFTYYLFVCLFISLFIYLFIHSFITDA